MKTKITIKREVETEMEIEFKAYRKYGYGFFEIENESDYLAVCTHPETFSIARNTGMNNCVALYLSEGKTITRQEFYEAYSKALILITKRSFSKEEVELFYPLTAIL